MNKELYWEETEIYINKKKVMWLVDLRYNYRYPELDYISLSYNWEGLKADYGSELVFGTSKFLKREYMRDDNGNRVYANRVMGMIEVVKTQEDATEFWLAGDETSWLYDSEKEDWLKDNPDYKQNSKISLKPCPFCGGTACEIRTDDDGDSYYVFCPECGASVGYSLTAEDCGLAWNMRKCEEENDER